MSPPPEYSLDARDTKIIHHHRDEHDSINNLVAETVASEVHDLARPLVARDNRNGDHGKKENNCKHDVEAYGNEDGEESADSNSHQKIKCLVEHSPFLSKDKLSIQALRLDFMQ